MMNRFNFRAWHEGKMWGAGITDDGHVTIDPSEYDDKAINFCECIGVLPGCSQIIKTCKTVMQSTGHVDRYGKEVFECDLIVYEYTEKVTCSFDEVDREPRFDLGLIFWSDRHAGFGIKWLKEKETIFTLKHLKDCRLVGNSFEDKHLLEDGE